MDTIFLNSENSNTFDLGRLLFNLLDKIDFKRSDKYVALSNLSIYYTLKNIKKSYKNSKFKIISSDIEWRVWITWLIIVCVIYSKLFWIYLKTNEMVTDNPYKIEKRITFKTKKGYYLELLTSQTMEITWKH